jgi:hypothetical protein
MQKILIETPIMSKSSLALSKIKTMMQDMDESKTIIDEFKTKKHNTDLL